MFDRRKGINSIVALHRLNLYTFLMLAAGNEASDVYPIGKT